MDFSLFLANFLVTAQQVAVLFFLIALGFFCGKRGIINAEASRKMTDVVLTFVTPCVMISAFQREFSMQMLGKVGVALLVAIGVHVASILLARATLRSRSEGRRKVLQFSVIFSNCGFMSLPLQKALLGDDGWFYGSIFLVAFNIFTWTYGLVDMSGDRRQLSLRKLITNPGIVGVTIALLLFVLGVHLPEVVSLPVGYMAALNTPVPMLIIGYHLSQVDFRRAFGSKPVYAATFMRLIVIPLLAILAMVGLGLDRTIVIAFTVAASAPAAVITTMFAAKYDREVELSVSTVTVSTILSLLTMPLIVSLAYTLTE